MQGPVLWKGIGTGLGNNTDIPKPEHAQLYSTACAFVSRGGDPTPVCSFFTYIAQQIELGLYLSSWGPGIL